MHYASNECPANEKILTINLMLPPCFINFQGFYVYFMSDAKGTLRRGRKAIFFFMFEQPRKIFSFANKCKIALLSSIWLLWNIFFFLLSRFILYCIQILIKFIIIHQILFSSSFTLLLSFNFSSQEFFSLKWIEKFHSL